MLFEIVDSYSRIAYAEMKLYISAAIVLEDKNISVVQQFIKLLFMLRIRIREIAIAVFFIGQFVPI